MAVCVSIIGKDVINLFYRRRTTPVDFYEKYGVCDMDAPILLSKRSIVVLLEIRYKATCQHFPTTDISIGESLEWNEYKQ